jgi:hypothetical protein
MDKLGTLVTAQLIDRLLAPDRLETMLVAERRAAGHPRSARGFKTLNREQLERLQRLDDVWFFTKIGIPYKDKNRGLDGRQINLGVGQPSERPGPILPPLSIG